MLTISNMGILAVLRRVLMYYKIVHTICAMYAIYHLLIALY